MDNKDKTLGCPVVESLYRELCFRGHLSCFLASWVNPGTSKTPSGQPRFSVEQVAEMRSISRNTIRRLFGAEPEVLKPRPRGPV
jgi:hypothetical protein